MELSTRHKDLPHSRVVDTLITVPHTLIVESPDRPIAKSYRQVHTYRVHYKGVCYKEAVHDRVHYIEFTISVFIFSKATETCNAQNHSTVSSVQL